MIQEWWEVYIARVASAGQGRGEDENSSVELHLDS